MKPATRRQITAAIIALLVLIAGGVALIDAYLEAERRRELMQWDSRLGLVAEARADAVHRLLAGYRREVQELADNASLRFYLWQLTRVETPAPAAVEPAAFGYLRNLLLAAAERYGYGTDGLRISANLRQPRTAGLAVLDRNLRLVVQTPGLLEVPQRYAEVARAALASPGTQPAVLMLDAEERPVLVTATAIGTVPGAGAAATATADATALGVVLAVRGAEDELFPALSRGPSFAENNETLLLAKRGESVALLSPTRDGSPGLRRTLPADRADLAEVLAVRAPGTFVEAGNYRGDRVLQVSRPVRGQDWILVQQIDAATALSAGDERRRFLLTAMSLLLFAVATLAIAAWRHGSSVRARHQAEEMAEKAASLQRQTDLLHHISDSLDAVTLLVTRQGQVLFANRAAAEGAGSDLAALRGQLLASFLPAALQREIHETIAHLPRTGAGTHRLLAWETAAGAREYRVSFIPVERIGEQTDAVLLVMGDVTALRQAQRRNMDLLRHLVLTLVSAVDRHDPWSAHHARRMTEVADALARELGFTDQERGTLNLAASLANIGKVMIPVEVLTKREPLTEAEQALVHRHVEFGLDLLKGLQFEGPVLEIIAQKQERPDGRGYPLGLEAERVTLAGQILAVANAFVALVSARAWRPGMTVNAALDELMHATGTQFDRRVVAALYHVAENRRDWSKWAETSV